MNQATDSGKLTDEFKGLYTRTVQGNMNLFKRLSALATDTAKEFSAGPQRKPLPSVGQALTRLAELNLSWFSAAADHSLAFANDLAGAYEKALGFPAAPASEPAIEVNVNARPGARARATFHVENKFSNSLDVSFQASDIRSPQGEVMKKTGPVTFNPPHLTLAPKTQAVVEAVVDVPDNFHVGSVYTLCVKLAGLPMKEVWIRLHVVAPASGAGTSRKVARKSKKSRRKAGSPSA